jgi:hypothetical protein
MLAAVAVVDSAGAASAARVAVVLREPAVPVLVLLVRAARPLRPALLVPADLVAAPVQPRVPAAPHPVRELAARLLAAQLPVLVLVPPEAVVLRVPVVPAQVALLAEAVPLQPLRNPQSS